MHLASATPAGPNVITSWPRIYLGVGLTTLAALLLELSLTRIFSVVFYYHFAFLAISIALFGLGVGGVFSYLVAGWQAPLFRKLGYLSMLNSLLVITALALAVVVFVFHTGAHDLIASRYAKGQKLKREGFVRWNSSSRIAVRDYPIFIDADASPGIATFVAAHPAPGERQELREQGPALPY